MSAMTLEQVEELAGKPVKRSASGVKARWRDIVEQAYDVGEVIVTNYDCPEAMAVAVEHSARSAYHHCSSTALQIA